ncbi:MAG: glycogen-binding domain-containing protein [Elusimicrobia bacterium]|nr:glycogen-binding domain-containing protein [Candidatus Obscuribacterium magneticum]
MEQGKTICEIISSAAKVVVEATIEIYNRIVDCLQSYKQDLMRGRDDTQPSEEILTDENLTEEKDPSEGERSQEHKETSNSTSTTTLKRKVTFKYHNQNAENVAFVGNFTDWQIRPMEKKNDGTWTFTVLLEPKRYLYKFVVDGQWLKDPKNPSSQSDGYGGESSILKVD